MAHHKSAIKRIKTNRKANLRNKHYLTRMRTSIRNVRECSDTDKIQNELSTACALLDRLASKGIIHRKTAARRKSRLNKLAQSLTA